jgi:membrane-bound inhibitor of C-type lysozyme
MKNIALLYFLALAVIGCSSNSSQHNSSGVNEISFTCDRGNPVQVRFFQNKEVAILVRDGKAIELQQEPSGSGFNYSNGSTSIRGKGNDLMVIIGRMAPINCTAQ